MIIEGGYLKTYYWESPECAIYKKGGGGEGGEAVPAEAADRLNQRYVLITFLSYQGF